MIDQFAQTIMERIKDQYPGIGIPGAMCAMITGAAEDGTYTTECKIFCEETGEEYHCRVEQSKYLYAVKVLDNQGGELPEYPELIEIPSRQQLEPGSLVQVVFLGNELKAALVGG